MRRRAAGFAAMIATAFGVALLLGSLVGPEPRADEGPDHAQTPGGHAAAEGEASGHGAAQPIRGLATAEDGHRLRLSATTLPRGRRAELAFDVAAPDGQPLTEYAVTHERRMHLIVVRRDGTGFQHLHPRMDADGTWRTPITLPAAGAYRVFADFEHDGARTLAADLSVDGSAAYEPFPAPRPSATTDGYRVELDGDPRAGEHATLRFTITKDGRPVTTQPYLGAGGHLVALREGDLAFLHVHPGEQRDGVVPFETTLPTAGRYRLYLQFKDAGTMRTVTFSTAAM